MGPYLVPPFGHTFSQHVSPPVPFFASGYFLILFDVMKSHRAFGHKMSDFYMHAFTLRNQMWNSVHMILRIVFHPSGVPFNPSRTMENICEQHFSQKKLGTAASPSIAACVYTTHKTHMKQLKHPVKVSPCITDTKITMEMASQIFQKSFMLASRLESVCSVGISAEQLRSDLLE